MKAQIFCLLLFVTGSGIAQKSWSDPSRLLPDRLRNLPTAISMYHSPTPVWPEVNNDTMDFSGKYIWKHTTRVTTETGALEVIAAGSYVWWKDKGWTPNIELDKEDFARYFKCPGGMLLPGKSYTFIKNYRHGDSLYAGDALWFVLAKDQNGRIYKGIAIVETEGTLKNRSNNMSTDKLNHP